MSEPLTFYAIKRGDGLFYRNTCGYGQWHDKPKLWMRRCDATQCLKPLQRRRKYDYATHRYTDVDRYPDAHIVQFEVKEIE